MITTSIKINRSIADKYISMITGEQIKIDFQAEYRKEQIKRLEIRQEIENRNYGKLVTLSKLLDHYINRVHLLPVKLERIIANTLETLGNGACYKSPLVVYYRIMEESIKLDINIDEILNNIQNGASYEQ